MSGEKRRGWIFYVLWISPVLLGVALCVFFLFNPRAQVIFRIEFILNAIITSVTTISGFILTSISILLGLTTPLMRRIRATENFKELSSKYTVSLVLGMVTVILSITLGGMVPEDNLIPWSWMGLMGGILVSYLLSISISGYYLLNIIVKGSINDEIEYYRTSDIPESLK